MRTARNLGALLRADISSAVHFNFNIERFLDNCVSILSKYINICGITIIAYHIPTNTMTAIAESLHGHERNFPRDVIIEKEIISDIYKDGYALSLSDDHATVEIMDFYKSKSLTQIHNLVSKTRTSNIRMNLYATNDVHYIANVYTFGQNKFTSKTLDIIRTMYEPLSFVIRHAIDANKQINHSSQYDAEKDYSQTDLFLTNPMPDMKCVMHLVRRAATVDVPVLILGETGVGKELVANAIQRLSARTGRPFVKVNCGAIPETLIDSELFGYEKGAFTGASTSKAGKFEQANHGTLFLDEIGELPLSLQARLLRVLQFHEVERVGGTKTIPLDIRVIAATHKNLEKKVAEGQFRKDLWFRLSVFPITIPPLRQRKNDISLMAKLLLERKCQTMRLTHLPCFSDDTLARFQTYSWPGNVREMENCIWRALITQQFSEELECVPGFEEAMHGADIAEEESADAFMTLDAMNALYIAKILKHTQGRVHGKGGAASIMGINPSTLRSRMAKLGMASRH